MMGKSAGFVAAMALCGALPAGAQEAGSAAARPELLGKLVECRRIADVEARASCYDRQVDALDQAERSGDVVVMDRKQMVQTRRSLFGFHLPKLAIFGRGDRPEDAQEFSQIETTLQDVAQGRDGRWLFVLADGARWRQTESRTLSYTPKAGQKIRIREAALGSFLANVEGHVAIRVARVN